MSCSFKSGFLHIQNIQSFPDSHNAGDFGAFLLGAPHEYAMTEETLKDKTDGHMDINKVRAGAILICPVKVPGGGVYVGDVHAMQAPCMYISGCGNRYE